MIFAIFISIFNSKFAILGLKIAKNQRFSIFSRENRKIDFFHINVFLKKIENLILNKKPFHHEWRNSFPCELYKFAVFDLKKNEDFSKIWHT